MIKRGDFVKCITHDYSITNMNTICLVINDKDSWEALTSDSISVMVIEDYNTGRSFKAIGSIYVVKREKFKKIDYTDNYTKDRERTRKAMMKLAKTKIPLTRERINHYASNKQLATCFSRIKGNRFYFSYVEDCVLKTYEVNLDVITDKPKQIQFHEISCFDIEGIFDFGELRTIEHLLHKNKKNVKTTKLFEKNMFEPFKLWV